MPHIRISTNVSRDKFDQQFVDTMLSEIAPINGKPEKVSISYFNLF